MFNKRKTSLPNALIAAFIISCIIIVPALVFAQPGAVPPEGNVDASFHSVTFPVGPSLASSFSRFVGVTPITYTGKIISNGKTGYAAAQDTCEFFYPGSHMCSANEIINSIEYGITLPSSGKAWINNGPPAYIFDVSNDCFGWQTDISNALDFKVNPDVYSIYGSIWNFSGNYSRMSTCDQQFNISCCSFT
jgi:hypothetical protein